MEFLGVVLIFQKLALTLILKVSNSRIQSYFHCFVPSDAKTSIFKGIGFFLFVSPRSLNPTHFHKLATHYTMDLFVYIN